MYPKARAKLGTPSSMIPLYVRPRLATSTVSPSTLSAHAAGELQLEPRRRDDDVGIELAARREADAPLGEGVDVVGDDVGLRPTGWRGTGRRRARCTSARPRARSAA